MTDHNHQARSDTSGDTSVASPRSSTDSRTSSSRSPPFRLSSIPTAGSQHRQSFGESLRAVPPSPRARRQPSLTQAAIQSLIDNPPSRNAADPAFSGRDWTQISIGELLNPDDVRFVESDTGIEDATNLLIESGVGALLIREKPEEATAIATFDYADLNAYLLLVVGLIQPGEEHTASLCELARKAREGTKIPLEDAMALSVNQPLTTLPPTANLMTAVETFGGGVHRVIVVKENSSEVVGVFSQSALVKFLWENALSFPVIDQLYPQSLRDLKIGSQHVISVNGDRPLFHALELMHANGISSVGVVDNQLNVVGNISVVDVKLLTKSTSLPLLYDTCIHFISVILSTRGLIEGRDPFPVFHVNPQSTLAHTVAKLVATKSHRMWVTDPHSPSSSCPTTPHPSSNNSMPSTFNHTSGNITASGAPLVSTAPNPNPNHHSAPPTPHVTQPHLTPIAHTTSSSATFPPSISTAIPASSLPGSRLSGHLVGVVSLTDILNLYARASGLSPADPNVCRSQRRRSSSSSLGVRKSGDVGREIWGRPGP